MNKKKVVEEPVKVLGRPGNHLKMGIVGLPNVGKSTLFNILTKLTVPAENYPFCTIEPNEARVAVPDARYDFLVNFFKPASAVPAYLTVTDIAGLVRGASSGEGLGNAFLSHIRAVDGIYHVVRVFDDDDITHVEGGIDPLRDLQIIGEELRKKDLDTVEKYYEKIEKETKRLAKQDKAKKEELETAQRLLRWLKEEDKDVRFGDWKTFEIDYINDLHLLTAKPVIYLVNLSQKDFLSKKNKWLLKIKNWVDSQSASEVLIPFSGKVESALLEMSDEQRKEFLSPHKAVSSIPKIVKTGFASLHLIYFFTSGEDEVKCWMIQRGTKAPQAAGTIHTDFLHGFICAEVMKFEDFKELGSESAVKASGKYHQQGKNYVVLDGDIIFFKVNAGAGLNKGK